MNRQCCIRKTKNERGYGLVVAVSIIALLTMLGLMVLDVVATDVQMAGGDRSSGNAYYLAEAGGIWAQQTLVTLVYPQGASGSATPGALTTLGALSTADQAAFCPDSPNPPCSTYYYMSVGTPSGNTVTYPGGSYMVAATCVPNCNLGTTPTSYIIRSLGTTTDGSAKRLIEITMGAN